MYVKYSVTILEENFSSGITPGSLGDMLCRRLSWGQSRVSQMSKPMYYLSGPEYTDFDSMLYASKWCDMVMQQDDKTN